MARHAPPIAAGLCRRVPYRIDSVSQRIGSSPGFSFPCRVPTCRAVAHRCVAIALLCHALRASPCSSAALLLHSGLALPCFAVALRFVRVPAKLLHCLSNQSSRCVSASNRRVSSGRPAFPQLRLTAPIPALPWPLRSTRIFALPFSSTSMHFDSLPSLLRRLPGGRFQAVLFRVRYFPIASPHFRFCSCRSVAPRLHSFSSLIFSAPLLAVSLRGDSVPFHGHAHHPASIRCLIAPVHVGSPQCPVDSFGRISHHLRVAAHPRLSRRCHALANRVRAMRFRFSSAHRRCVPFRFRSDQSPPALCSAFSMLLRAMPCESSPFDSSHLRVRSALCATAGLVAVSHRVSTARCRIGSDQVQSQHRKSMSIRLESNPG